MFDWVPKKNQQQPNQIEKKNDIDLDELFAFDKSEPKPTQPIKTEEKKEAPQPKAKAPAVPKVEKKQEIKIDEAPVFIEAKEPVVEQKNIEASTNDDLTLLRPTIIEDSNDLEKKEVKFFHIDDEKISPHGAASIHQDEIRKQKDSSKNKWELPDILGFLNDVDAQAVFAPSIKDMQPEQVEQQQVPSILQHTTTAPIKENSEANPGNNNDDDNDEDELIKKLIKGRFPFHSGHKHFEKELKQSSSPYSNAFMDTIDAPPTMIVDDFGDRSLWELQLNNSNLPGMELEEFTLMNYDHIHINEMRRGFKRARRDFIKFISYNNQQDLFSAGLKDVDIALLRKGYVCENFNIHRKVPYEYGGNNDFSNFCLIQTHPYHDNLHKFLDMQVFIHPKGAKVKRLFIPIPNGNIYLPYLDINGSGGKSKHDRSVYAGFHKETFDLINLKTSMGKAAEL